MGLDGNPVKDASGALSFWPNPAAHPEGAIGFLEARGASRDHRPTGLRTSLRAQDVLRMSADTNGSAGIWAMPMMRQHSWSPMGHAQGHTDAAGNLFGRASPALGHRRSLVSGSNLHRTECRCNRKEPHRSDQDLCEALAKHCSPYVGICVPCKYVGPKMCQFD